MNDERMSDERTGDGRTGDERTGEQGASGERATGSGERERGPPPERQSASVSAPDQHPSSAGEVTPPHGDPLRREIDPRQGDRPAPVEGTRHGADAGAAGGAAG